MKRVQAKSTKVPVAPRGVQGGGVSPPCKKKRNACKQRREPPCKKHRRIICQVFVSICLPALRDRHLDSISAMIQTGKPYCFLSKRCYFCLLQWFNFHRLLIRIPFLQLSPYCSYPEQNCEWKLNHFCSKESFKNPIILYCQTIS